MSKIKSPPAVLNAKPGWYRYRLRVLLVVLIAAALAMGVAKLHFHEPRLAYRTLPELLALGKYAGFELVQGPERPGPYVEMGAACAGKGEPLLGSFWANGKTCRYHVPGVPGEERCVIGLMPQDGSEPTYVVLRKGVPPLPPRE
jgi:hypothetical protein